MAQRTNKNEDFTNKVLEWRFSEINFPLQYMLFGLDLHHSLRLSHKRINWEGAPLEKIKMEEMFYFVLSFHFHSPTPTQHGLALLRGEVQRQLSRLHSVEIPRKQVWV